MPPHLAQRRALARSTTSAALAAAVAAAALVPATAHAASGTITTILGVGIGDGFPATQAFLRQPMAAAVTVDGGVLIADSEHNRIRRVGPDGTITTVAGDGLYGSGGDGGPATAAHLRGPRAIAAAPDGSFVFADGTSGTIRRVDARGIITTIAGTGTPGYSATSTVATRTPLNRPSGLAYGPNGALYIADTNNRRIRKLLDGQLTTIAGTGAASSTGDAGPATAATFESPTGVAVDSQGGVLVADPGAAVVRRIAPNGTITTVAGTGTGGRSGDGGPATAAALNGPSAVAALADGSFVIADTSNDQVRRVNAAGTIALVAGARDANLPWDTAGDGGPAALANVERPASVAVAAGGALVIAEQWGNRVRRIAANGTISTIAGTRSTPAATTDAPATRVAVGGIPAVVATAGGVIRVIDAAHDRVVRISPNGIASNEPGLADFSTSRIGSTTLLNSPSALGSTADGALILGDSFSRHIVHASPVGTLTSLAGANHPGSYDAGVLGADAAVEPSALAVAPDGSIVFTDQSQPLIRRLTAAGRIEIVAGALTVPGTVGDGGLATDAVVERPAGLAYAPDRSLYFTDERAHTIRRIDPQGRISRVAGTGHSGFTGDGGPAVHATLDSPTAIAVAPDGTVVVADAGNGRVRAIDTDGNIRTLAGTGQAGDTGDGGPATRATFVEIASLAATADGAIVVGDWRSGRLRRIDAGLVPQAPATAPPTPAPQAAPAVTPPTGSTGVAGAANALTASLGIATKRAAAGSRITLLATTSRASRVRITVTRGRRTIATLSANTIAGAPTRIAWTTRRRGRPLAAGAYTLTLRATTPDGATATSTGRLVLRPTRSLRP
jgi:sugar lactone lactonase YvrE